MTIFVVIPIYNESRHISDVLKQIPEEVQQIVVVDDCSEDNSSEIVLSEKDERVKLIRHEKNIGVGGAMVTGYKYSLKAGADIVVKIDGDGQMDPAEIPRVVSPIKNGEADYAKGFRFYSLENIGQMPIIRLIGNIILSFLTKIASGYWNIFDPTNGYTAIHRVALSRINLNGLNQGYFFETDMLARLYRIHAVVRDVQISNRYGPEVSNLNPLHVSLKFPYLLAKAFVMRILWRYFVADFTPVSLFILLGFPMFLYGAGFGLYSWVVNAKASIATPLGTIMLAVVPLFFGFQFLLQSLVLDINSVPKDPLQRINR
jgi:glycosyltransferase involved in cell wall biosynthesis